MQKKKNHPSFTAIICQVTSTSAPHRHDCNQFLVAIFFNYKMNSCSVLIEVFKRLSIHVDSLSSLLSHKTQKCEEIICVCVDDASL